ncbi:MAG: rhomboid family protein [Deinococcales bacterium]
MAYRLGSIVLSLTVIRRLNWSTNETPPATFGLLLGLFALYLLSCLVLDSFSNGEAWQRFLNGSSAPALNELGANARFVTLDGREYWRLLTATLLHGGFVHLLMNSFSLWNLGRQLEQSIGWQELLFAYVVTGLSSSLLSALFGEPRVVSIGASGAIFGLLGFLISFGARDFFDLKDQISRNASIVLVALLLPAFIPNIDHWGHIGGVASGLVLGFCYRYPLQGVRQLLGISSGVLLLAGAGMIVAQALRVGF